MEKEIRSFDGEFKTFKNDSENEESRQIEGMAVVFNSQSSNLGFYETIEPGAITEDVLLRSDILCKLNHDDQKILARSRNGEGSLHLELTDKGLLYRFDSPHTSTGDEILEYLKRGDISQSSFAFTVSKEKGAETWEKRDGKIFRTIHSIDKIYDVSPVFSPAYPTTSCSARFEEINKTAEEVEKIMQLNKEEIEKL